MQNNPDITNNEMTNDEAIDQNQANIETNTNDLETQEVDINTPNDKLQTDLDQANKKYLYLLSEFENYKRRTAKERIDLFKTASKDVLIELLPVLDDFERGINSIEKTDNVEALKEGVELIYSKLKTILTNKGLKPIDTLGQTFDTDLHEAISQMPVETQEQKNKVVVEVEKGYTLNDTLIRFAKVIVGV